MATGTERAPGAPARRPRHAPARPRLAAALALVAVVAGALAAALPARAAVSVVVIEGRGFGHGVGMAQDGAYWMGVDGASTPQILGQFYPGTAIGQGGGDVRVVVSTPAAGASVVAFPAGGEVRSPLEGPQAPGFPIRVAPGGAVRLRFDGAYRAEPLAGATARASGAAVPIELGSAGPRQLPFPSSSTTSSTTTTSTTAPSTTSTTSGGLLPGRSTTTSTTAPGSSTTSTTSGELLPGPTTTTAPPGPGPAPAPPTDPGQPPPTTPPPADPGAPTSTGPLWAVPDGGGTTEVTERARRYRGVVQATAAGGPFRLVNHVDVEQYLRGMGEVRDSRWSLASLGAQAVAARTYALRTTVAGGELCDTQRCQVYLGQQAEYPKMDEAVRATAGQVLTFGRGLAVTVYSANGAGVSATPQEGFGTNPTGTPYLVAQPYPTRSPDPWRVDIGAADLGARLGYPGGLTGVRVASTGPSGRPLTVVLSGSGGDVEVGAIKVQRAAGLRSTQWQVRTEEAAVAPVAPPAVDAVQVLPEQVAAAAPAVAPGADGAAAVARRPGRAVEVVVPGIEEPGGRGAPDVALPLLLGAVAAAGAAGLATLVPLERSGTVGAAAGAGAPRGATPPAAGGAGAPAAAAAAAVGGAAPAGPGSRRGRRRAAPLRAATAGRTPPPGSAAGRGPSAPDDRPGTTVAGPRAADDAGRVRPAARRGRLTARREP